MAATDTQNNEFLERMQRIETLIVEIQQLPDPTVRSHSQELVQTLLELHRTALERMVEYVTKSEDEMPHNGREHFRERGGQEIEMGGGRLATPIGGQTGGAWAGSALHACARDKLVSSVLLLHDLHPWDLRTRVQYALDEAVRPYLRSEGGDAELVSVDSAWDQASSVQDDQASIRIKVNEGKNAGHQSSGGGGGCGCGSSGPDDLKEAIQNAIRDWAPDLGEIEIDGITDHPKTQEGLVQLTIAHGSS